MKIIVTCPPMLCTKDQFVPILEAKGFEVECPNVTQTLTEKELIKLIPDYDGWIIGDDPATKKVFSAAKKGKLKAAVKWGIGIDNVDLDACRNLGIPITNTPNMFGSEVADLSIGYLLALARETFFIDRDIRQGNWPKNQGISLPGKTVGIIGYGDIGKRAASRAKSFELNVIAYDPGKKDAEEGVDLQIWPNQINKCDFLIFTCALNKFNHHMLNKETISKCKDGVRIINVARGPLIDEKSLCEALKNRKIHSAALDVFEVEPLPFNSYLRNHPLCILGSHNASNTIDAVKKTNMVAIDKLISFLEI